MPNAQITRYVSMGEAWQYMPYMSSLVSTMLPRVLYTDNDEADNDNNAVPFHKLSWPLAKSAKSPALLDNT